jgi:rhodanese-related sulfurtransferase
MMLQTVTPGQARRRVGEGAILVDIREADEHERERIPQALHLPLSKLDKVELALHEGKPVIFHCLSGARTLRNAPRLAARVGTACEAYVLEGGLDAWRKAGLPVVTDRRHPLELQRQVQIGAGGLALAGTLLGALVSSWFFILPGFVGGGLLVAGITGFCGMAQLLMRAPWNRATFSPPVSLRA